MRQTFSPQSIHNISKHVQCNSKKQESPVNACYSTDIRENANFTIGLLIGHMTYFQRDEFDVLAQLLGHMWSKKGKQNETTTTVQSTEHSLSPPHATTTQTSHSSAVIRKQFSPGCRVINISLQP